MISENKVDESCKDVGRRPRLIAKSVIKNASAAGLQKCPHFSDEDIKSAFYYISLFKKEHLMTKTLKEVSSE